MSNFQPLKLFYDLESTNEIIKDIPIVPLRSYRHKISINDSRFKSEDANARVKEVDLNSMILGYDIAHRGNPAIGHPSYYRTLKNGLNFDPFTISVEEDNEGNMLSFFLEKLGNTIGTRGTKIVQGGNDNQVINSIKIELYDNGNTTVRTYEIDSCIVLGVDIPSVSTSSNDTVKYSINLHPLGIKVTDNSITEELTNKRNYFQDYKAPMLDYLWVAFVEGMNPIYIQDVDLKISPSLSVDYLGNPKYGKPPRCVTRNDSEVGTMNITLIDDKANTHLNSILNSDSIFKYNSTINALKGSNVSEIKVIKFTKPKHHSINELVPTLEFIFSKCMALNVIMDSIVDDSNDLRKIRAEYKIGGVEINREDGFGIDKTTIDNPFK
jgi:hypothetical protein